MKKSTILAVIFMIPVSLMANNICEAVALRTVPAIENPDAKIFKGEKQTSITQYVEDETMNITAFCSKGGYCYPTHVFLKRERVEALKLLNCKIGEAWPKEDFEDPKVTIYGLKVNRSKNPPQTIKQYDLTNQLEKLGLVPIVADNAAQFYIHKPASKCARLTKSVLEGDPNALQELESFPDYCGWQY